MGCCQSLPEVVEPVVQRRKGGTPVVESCFPEKHGPGGYKVLVTTSSAELDFCPTSGTARGRAYARTVVGPTWLFACVFECLPVPGDSGDVRSRGVYSDAAAQYCADTAYEVFAQQQQARRSTGHAQGAGDMAGLLGAVLAALDRRFLNDPAVMPQDRLGSGCTGVLLHMDLAAPPEGAEAGGRVAAVAAVGPCAAVLGQRQGGFASATAAPQLLAGGNAASHAAVCELLERLGAERSAELVRVRQQLQQAQAGAKAKPGKGVQQPPQPVLSAVVSAAPQEPSYAPQPEAPAVLGFGACKGMGQLVALPPGGVGPVPAGAAPGAAPGEVPPTPPPCVGLAVQTARHVLQPADESLMLLGAGAVAALSPAEAVLLMHRFGQFAFISSEDKPAPLDSPASSSSSSLSQAPAQPQAVQADSHGKAGPRPPTTARGPGHQTSAATAAAGGGAGVAPFNAARLVSQQAAMAVGRRRAQRTAAAAAAGGSAPPLAGFPSCCAVLALSLDWSPAGAGRDPASPAGVVAGSPAALAAAAAAALREGRRGLYRWQQLRAYYKLASRRRAALIARWHDLFDRVVGAAAQEAKAKEVTAWKRMGAALQVSTAGKVKVIEGSSGQQPQQPAAAVAAPAAAALAAAAAARGSPMRPAAPSASTTAATSGQAASRSPSPPPPPPPATAAAAVSQQQQPVAARVAQAPAKAEAHAARAPSPPAAAAAAQEHSPPPLHHSAIRLEERPLVGVAQRYAVAVEGASEQDTAVSATAVATPPAQPAASAAGTVAGPHTAVTPATAFPSSRGAASPAAGVAALPAASPHMTPRGSTGGSGIPTPPATTPSRSSGGAPAASPVPLLGSMTRSGSSRLPAAPGAGSSGGASSGGASAVPQQRNSPPVARTVAPSAARPGAPPALSPPLLEAEGEAGADLMSPDADQLALWAAEAAEALAAGPQQPQQQSGGGALQGAARGSMGRATAAAAGSRIPLSPSRADNISSGGPAGAKATSGAALAGGVAASR
ncbi:hypothetical protein CHLRE_04g233102v5 [Chlamydomonas reinhardtii]|uniref:Uncharacterized protein n=1 Tax=Chlamydomonas reinhardtii TaxID=3055 RepID=A0A2K3DV12_CHLRE|nr:uncharacterized protein CHLRE_04g233102v5 [Chlamydomonas reinhardtii]PNW84368.1 hypothetical protein CHLRE_04g233102v5 [Chlamydomonas reinhardtii]